MNENTQLYDWQQFDLDITTAKQPIAIYKKAIATSNEVLKCRFNLDSSIVTPLVTLRSTFIDQLLQRAWNYHFALVLKDPIALIAVGGYGRGELHPASDIDLLILLEVVNEKYNEPIENFLTFLWDIGLDVGHSVRTIQESVALGSEDITIATTLMESRRIIGSQSLYQGLVEQTGPDKIWSSANFFNAKLKEQQDRHKRFGDTAYNLEPNIKENPGGLRDLQVIGWVVKRHFGATNFKELIYHGFLTEREYQSLIYYQDFLWKIRFALHIVTGRREDRLKFELQRKLATMFGFVDSKHKMAVEIFMKEYYRTVMALNRLNEMLLQLFDEVIVNAGEHYTPEKINDRFQSQNGYIEVIHPNIFKEHPYALLEIFLILAGQSKLRGVRAETIRLIRSSLHLIDDKFRNDRQCQNLFIELFRQSVGLTHELRRMNRYGVLAKYVPAFGNIVGQMQHDMFHVFTVDEHTLFLIRNLRRFTVAELSHEFPLCSGIIQKIAKPELVYLAGFFHDIAKGRGGNHSELGVIDATEFGQKHHLSEYDTKLIAWLVENHLTMSVIAQKKDVSDPDIINDFATLIGSQERLNYLFLLTVADIRATSPQLWNSWKESLLNNLYFSTTRAFRRGLDNLEQKQERITQTKKSSMTALLQQDYDKTKVENLWRDLEQDYFLRFSDDEIIWQTETIIENLDQQQPLVKIRQRSNFGRTELFVYAEDNKHTFANITATIDRLQLTVTDARVITSSNGKSLITLIILEQDGKNVEDDFRIEEIITKVNDEITGKTEVKSAYKIAHLLIPSQVKQFNIKPNVSFTIDKQHNQTEIEIISRDQPGLLAKISRVVLDHDLQIRNAKVATFGARAEDVFYVVNKDGNALIDENKLSHLKNDLIDKVTIKK